MSHLRVAAIRIKDVLGAKEFSISPGKITVISGPNGSGKSSILEGIQSALGGGNLSKIARVGADDEPEIVLVLEGDQGEHFQLEKVGSKTVRVRERVGDSQALKDVGKPQAWLSSQFDPRGSNPVAFLMATDKERVLMLLEALNVTLDRDALQAVVGAEAWASLPAIRKGQDAFEELQDVRQGIFDARTGVGRDAKAAAASAEQLRRNIPAVLPSDHAETILTGEASVAELTAQIAAGEAQAKAAHTLALSTIASAFQAKAKKLRADLDAESASMRAEVERQIALKAAAVSAEIEILREADEAEMSAADKAKETAEVALSEQRSLLSVAREDLARLRAEAESGIKARALQEQAESFETQADTLKAKQDRLTDSIDALDLFRRRLLDNLPIKGLEIEGGAVMKVDGVPYDQVNTARKLQIAVDVACLRASGPLPLVFVDGAEALDSKSFDALVAELGKRPVQAMLARVSDAPFSVESA